MNNKYIFTGVVHPQRVDVNIPKLKFEVKDMFLGIEGVIESSCFKSLVTVTFEAKSNSFNILEVRNIIRDVISIRVHYLGFSLGCGYDVEIDRVIFPNSDVQVFGVDFPALQNKIQSATPPNLNYLNVISGESSPFVSIILSDFNRALTDSKNLPFHCYRCIEAIMQFFKSGEKKDKVGWERMRDTLNIMREDIDYIKELADPVRHGSPVGRTDQQGVDAVIKTWDILLKFFEYLSNKSQSIT